MFIAKYAINITSGANGPMSYTLIKLKKYLKQSKQMNSQPWTPTLR